MLDVNKLVSIEAWRSFSPKLHIGDQAMFTNVATIDPSQEQASAISSSLNREGYVQASGVDWGLDLGLMAATVRALTEANLSPAFAFLYDEFWVPFIKLHPIYTALLGDYMMLPDFWVWNVDPAQGDSGWRPHRDKGHWALRPDGSPKSLTTWIALSSSTPLNGCMYLVPANFDPTYGTAEDKEWKFEYSSVRALPAAPGDFFIWNQAVLHWGGKTTPRAPETRVSIAFEFQRADVEPMNAPLIKPLSILSFDTRLRLVAKQILQYRHMYKVDPQVERVALALVA